MRKKQRMKNMSGDFPGLLVTDTDNLRETVHHWRTTLHQGKPLWIELGPGRGRYLVEMAKRHPERLFLGLDIMMDRLVEIALKVKKENLNNILLAQVNYRELDLFLGKGDVAGVIVNFPEPRIKASQAKRRFSHPRNLEKLVNAIGLGGELWFKTDDPLFFEWSYPFLREVLDIEYETRDLEHASFYENEPKTEYEERWLKQGKLFAALKGKVRKLTVETPVARKSWKTFPETPT